MSKTILAVDDSVTMLQTISLALEKEGYNVVTAKDGMDALNVLKGGEKFHVIITDVNMPVMDGIALTAEIRKLSQYKFTPIIILTTESQAGKKDEGKQAGATGWIVKPFKPEQLIAVVRRVSP
ncbi:MAG: response regulator [Deltaproteobacteria bacterium]|nr:response regulator [Deltaproteobacteria bacterium]